MREPKVRVSEAYNIEGLAIRLGEPPIEGLYDMTEEQATIQRNRLHKIIQDRQVKLKERKSE